MPSPFSPLPLDLYIPTPPLGFLHPLHLCFLLSETWRPCPPAPLKKGVLGWEAWPRGQSRPWRPSPGQGQKFPWPLCFPWLKIFHEFICRGVSLLTSRGTARRPPHPWVAPDTKLCLSPVDAARLAGQGVTQRCSACLLPCAGPGSSPAPQKRDPKGAELCKGRW